MQPEIIHIPQLAIMMGRSEASIRSAIRDGASWLPPSFKQGVRHCWRVESVRKWLAEYEAGAHRPKRPGRPRREPPTLHAISQGLRR